MTIIESRIEFHKAGIRILELEISDLLVEIGKKRDKIDEHNETIENLQSKLK